MMKTGKYLSARGEEIDLMKYLAQNEDAIAVGNANMNARGDLIGRGGKVVKKREEIAAEYHQNNPRAVKQVALRDLSKEVFQTPAEAVRTAEAQVKAIEEKKGKTRKIVDSDD